ncbi:alpha-1,6-mannosyltransferase subunit [Mycena latifolia]|nr:alpha-1,6-mannosyltransferase subunit [Mycena latifolia]
MLTYRKALVAAAVLLSLFILMPGSLDPPPPSLRQQLAHAFPHDPHSEFPALIWQTWKDAPSSPSFPRPLLRAVESWDVLHPSYEHFVLDDAAALNLTIALFGSVPAVVQAYEALPLPVLRADFFRYLILLARGGVYSDIDTHALQPADLWVPAPLAPDAGLVVGIEADPDSEDWHKWFARRVQFCQWTLRAKAGHPVLREAVARITEETLRLQRAGAFDTGGAGLDVMELTGPGVWTDVLMAHFNREFDDPDFGDFRGAAGERDWDTAREERITYTRFTRLTAPTTERDVAVLPITAFSPGVGWMGAGPVSDPAACVWHLFEGSWKHAPTTAPSAGTTANASGSARHEFDTAIER